MLAKKLLFLAMLLVLTLGFTFNNTTHATSKVSKEDYSSQTEEEKQAYKEKLTNLTQEEIVSNFERINREYNLGRNFH
ncbi:hypothetical protein QKW52_24965 [Bacillus sonorensis]|nr:hypothetical protein [Bacillus sonorensis]